MIPCTGTVCIKYREQSSTNNASVTCQLYCHSSLWTHNRDWTNQSSWMTLSHFPIHSSYCKDTVSSYGLLPPQQITVKKITDLLSQCIFILILIDCELRLMGTFKVQLYSAAGRPPQGQSHIFRRTRSQCGVTWRDRRTVNCMLDRPTWQLPEELCRYSEQR